MRVCVFVCDLLSDALCGLCLCVFGFVCEWLLLFRAFVCFVRVVLCAVVWCVVMCVVSVLDFWCVNCVCSFCLSSML